MISVIKSSIKLMLRSKVFIFFLLIIPVATTLILSIKINTDQLEQVNERDSSAASIVELPSCTERATYYGRTVDDMSVFIVKVYDASGSELSEYLLERIDSIGMFSVCRADVSSMTEEEVYTQAELDAYMDRAGCLLYLKYDFDRAVLDGNLENAMQLFTVSDDERMELLETDLSDILEQIKSAQSVCGDDTAAILELLNTITDSMPKKITVSLSSTNEIKLTSMQGYQSGLIGKAFSISIIGFMFAGLYIAQTVIEEKNNKVFLRVMLSKIGNKEYFAAKFIAMLLINILQVVVLAVCLSVMISADFGLSIADIMTLMFPLGLIFSTFSLILGILIGDVMNSNYVTLAVWCVSSLLSGSWFVLIGATDAIKAVSSIMPQKIFNDAARMLLAGDNSGYAVVLYTSVAYLLVTICVGSVGIKMQEQEQ